MNGPDESRIGGGFAERVGADLRDMMPFLKPVRVTPDSSQAATSSAPAGASEPAVATLAKS